MKSEKLQDAIGMIDENLLIESPNNKEKQKKTAKHFVKWTAPIAAVLALAFIITGFFGKETPFVLNAYAIAEARYPETAPYPENEQSLDFEKRHNAWSADKRERRSYYEQAGSIEHFVKNSLFEILSDENNDNPVYSPLNIYMALAMLAEITDGESRNEVLSLLGSESIQSLRKKANALWNANYCNDGAVTSILASSLWLNDSVNFNENTLKTLAEEYFASSYRGTMGSGDFNQALQNWLNEQTGGLLKDQIHGIEMPADTVMALFTTIYFRAKWETEFFEKNNTKDIFHGKNGDTTVDFMHESELYGNYYWGENFSATSKRLENSGSMWFILPDEGTSVDTLLSDEEALAFIGSIEAPWKNHKELMVNLSVPKFDISAEINLKKALQTLGVEECFDLEKANFSPLLKEDDAEVFLSEAKHGARVAIDEEGVTAAAYTEMILCGAGMPPQDEIDFVLDRPFIFVITGESGLPLFIGVVRNIET